MLMLRKSSGVQNYPGEFHNACYITNPYLAFNEIKKWAQVLLGTNLAVGFINKVRCQENSGIHMWVYRPNKPPLILPGLDEIDVGI